MNERGRRLDRAWLLGCLALAAGLRLFRIGHQSLWIDELISLGLATYAGGVEFWSGLLRDIHGPFTSALLHVWTKAGVGEAWMRLLFVVPSVVTVVVAWTLGRELFDRRTARVAALVFAVSPLLVWYAQEVRNYAWLLLWVTAACVLFVRAYDGRATGRTWVGLGALAILGVLTNYTFVFLLAALTVALLVRRPLPRAALLPWAGVLATAGLVFLPWFLDWFHRIGGERIFVDAPPPMGVPLREAPGLSPAGIGYTAWTFLFGYSLGPSLHELHLDRSVGMLVSHAPVLLTGFLVLAVAGVAGLRRAFSLGRGGLALCVVAVPLGLAIVLALRDVKVFQPRYVMVCLPVFFTVLAAGWAHGGRVVRASGAAALVLIGISLFHHYFDPAYAKEDSRAAAHLILEKEAPGDSVVVIYAFRPFRHYFADTADGKARLLHLHKRFLRTDDDLRRHVADARSGDGRVWLVLSRWWDVAPEARIRRIFEESLHEAGRWEFPGVKVTLYEEERA